MPCFGYSTLLPQSFFSTHKMEGELKILEINQKSENMIHIHLVFVQLRTFIAMSLRGNLDVWLECTKTWESQNRNGCASVTSRCTHFVYQPIHNIHPMI